MIWDSSPLLPSLATQKTHPKATLRTETLQVRPACMAPQIVMHFVTFLPAALPRRPPPPIDPGWHPLHRPNTKQDYLFFAFSLCACFSRPPSSPVLRLVLLPHLFCALAPRMRQRTRPNRLLERPAPRAGLRPWYPPSLHPSLQSVLPSLRPSLPFPPAPSAPLCMRVIPCLYLLVPPPPPSRCFLLPRNVAAADDASAERKDTISKRRRGRPVGSKDRQPRVKRMFHVPSLPPSLRAPSPSFRVLPSHPPTHPPPHPLCPSLPLFFPPALPPSLVFSPRLRAPPPPLGRW